VVPSHVAEPFDGTEHALHDAPHVATLALDTHAPPQLWNPALQEIPHDVPLQVAEPFAGVEHGVHELVPHVFGSLLLTHAPAQT